MYTEQPGNNGFLSRLKNVFSSSQTQQNDEVIDVMVLDKSATSEVVEQSSSSASSLPESSPYIAHESITEKEIGVRTVGVSAPVRTVSEEKDLDIKFATSFVEAGGKFIFCESIKDAVENLKLLKQDNRWSHVFCWENEVKDAFYESGFQRNAIGFTIENSDAAVSLCETLVAEDGTILLNPKQASRRRLSCFPKTHIIFTDITHLAGSEMEGLEKFYQLHKGELPSIIKLGRCNTGHFYDKQRLILNAEGPEDVYVFLIDEIIPVSLRP